MSVEYTETPHGEHDPDGRGYYGPYGGRFMPEALIGVVDEVAAEYDKARTDPDFIAEFRRLLRDYAGRPSLLTEAKRFGEHAGGARIFLKR
ncbi:tryptophan synthase subunit beta, partial [Amycolatopsis thailandensis]